MDIDPDQIDDGTDISPDADAWNPWNLPRAVPVPVPRAEEWPERGLASEDGLARLDGTPAA